MPGASQPQDSDDALKAGVAAWQHFAKNAALDDTERFLQAKRELDAQIAEQQRAGYVPTINETWKKVSGKGTTDSRKVVEAKDIHHHLGYPARELNPITPSPAQPTAYPPPQTIAQPPAQVRSRYQDLFDQSQRAVPVPMPMVPARAGTPSPPEPDCEWHPAYGESTQRPTVKLPHIAVKPVVKLPPSQTPMTPSASASQPVHALPPANAQVQRAASPAVHGPPQPLVANSTWQDRFTALLGTKASPEKRFASVSSSFSASKTPLEHSHAGRTTTSVTLPPKTSAQLLTPSFEDEEALFEEPREMGFVPAVRVPPVAPAALWPPAAPEPYVHPKLVRAMALRPEHVQSVVPDLPIGDAVRNHTVSVTVRLRGMSEAKVKKMPARGTAAAAAAGHPPNHHRGGYHHGSLRGKPRGRKSDHAGGANPGAGPQQPQGGPQGLPQTRNGGPAPGMTGPRPRNKSGGGAHGPGSWTREPSGVTA